MSPGTWVVVIAGIVALCWIVAYLDEVAHGTAAERKAFEAKRAKDDAEALLRNADKEVTDRPRLQAISEPLFNRERNL